jgi:hypothetical protein
MAIRISLTNDPLDGVTWLVVERGKILRAGTADTEPLARAAAIQASKEIGFERFVSAIK